MADEQNSQIASRAAPLKRLERLIARKEQTILQLRDQASKISQNGGIENLERSKKSDSSNPGAMIKLLEEKKRPMLAQNQVLNTQLGNSQQEALGLRREVAMLCALLSEREEKNLRHSRSSLRGLFE